MIEARELTKWYGPTLAVDAISFGVERGQVVGFLGPNGAGKSTTLRILTGFLPPTRGTATIAGHDVLTDADAARDAIGYLPESNPLYPEMRVEEYLHFHGRLHAMPRKDRVRRIGEVCERCGLAHNRRRVIGQLSKGNRQRVGLAQALLHEPEVLILDEPTAGLDPNQIGGFRELVRELAGKHTVLLSTHILPEVERTADRVLIIARGKIVAEGTPDELRRGAFHKSGGGSGASGASGASGGATVVEAKADAVRLKGVLKAVAGVASVEVEPLAEGWVRGRVHTEDDADRRESLAAAVISNGLPLRELHHERGSLEAFFINITAEQATAPAERAFSPRALARHRRRRGLKPAPPTSQSLCPPP